MKIEEIASRKDLELELFLRKRENNTLVWKTKEGDSIPIKDLKDEHLINIINMLDRNLERECEYLEAIGSLGEMEIL